jgi:hypothetical protein
MYAVRIKYYGMFWMTRRTYLFLQVIAFGLCLVMMVAGAFAMIGTRTFLPRFASPAGEPPIDLVWQIVGSLFWIGLAVLMAEGVETIVVLRMFAAEEAQEKARRSLPSPGPLLEPDHSAGVRLTPEAPRGPNTYRPS